MRTTFRPSQGGSGGVLGVTKGAATKALPQITLFATYEAASPLFSRFLYV